MVSMYWLPVGEYEIEVSGECFERGMKLHVTRTPFSFKYYVRLPKRIMSFRTLDEAHEFIKSVHESVGKYAESYTKFKRALDAHKALKKLDTSDETLQMMKRLRYDMAKFELHAC